MRSTVRRLHRGLGEVLRMRAEIVRRRYLMRELVSTEGPEFSVRRLLDLRLWVYPNFAGGVIYRKIWCFENV